MQLILKSSGSNIVLTGDDVRDALNLKFLCNVLDINYNSLNTLISRDGYTVDSAIQKLLSKEGGNNAS